MSNIASPPYTYNDPRIIYNEPCFFYNGGYDLICLGLTINVGKGGGGAVGKQTIAKPQPKMINILFKTCLDYVNDEEFKEEYCEIKEFRFKKFMDVNFKIEEVTLKGKRLTLTSEIFSPKIIKKHMSASADNITIKKTEISSSLMQLRLKSYISSSLVLNTPNKIKVKTSIINKKEDKEE
jgi:hypothetical protein